MTLLNETKRSDCTEGAFLRRDGGFQREMHVHGEWIEWECEIGPNEQLPEEIVTPRGSVLRLQSYKDKGTIYGKAIYAGYVKF